MCMKWWNGTIIWLPHQKWITEYLDMMKDETKCSIILCFVELWSKLYTYKLDGEKSKGVRYNILQNKIT